MVLLCVATWFDYVCLLTGSVCGFGCLKLCAVFDLLVFTLDWCGSHLLSVCSLTGVLFWWWWVLWVLTC